MRIEYHRFVPPIVTNVTANYGGLTGREHADLLRNVEWIWIIGDVRVSWWRRDGDDQGSVMLT